MKKLIFAIGFTLNFSVFAQVQNLENISESTQKETATVAQAVSFSEALHFTKANESEFSLTPKMQTNSAEYKSLRSNNKTNIESKVNTVGLSFNRGLAGGYLSAGFNTSFGTLAKDTNQSNTSRTARFSGFSDLIFNLKSFSQLSETKNLFYGIDVGISLEKNKLASSKIDGNRYSGGNSIKPFIAYENKLNFGAMGGKISHNFLGERTSQFESQNYSETVTNGNETLAEIFAEMNLNSKKIGASFNYLSVDGENIFVNEAGVRNSFSSDKYVVYESSLYGAINLDSGFDFIPKISYTANQTGSRGNVKYLKNDALALSLMLRTHF